MKKQFFSFLSFIVFSTFAIAGPGDTSVVQANIVNLNYYNNFDTTVLFPDGSKSYRKIILEFELGKYHCPGYDPNNPGPNGTGWCGDWDYDVHIIACVPGGDTVEMARLITPYANTNFPRTPLSWTHDYLFDVTDFYPILQDSVTIRIFYAGYSGGFTANVKFHFIEGTPPRPVLGMDVLWHGRFDYGNTGNPIESHIAPIALTFPANAFFAETKLIITGHGADNTANCSEFCNKWVEFKVDSNVIEHKNIWRNNCGSNFLYPQSGTWIYDRANWCPGDLVHDWVFNVPSTVTPGNNFSADLYFQPYTSSGGASYRVSATMFYYGAFAHQTDAGVEAIISPNDMETYYRSNPICGNPEITIRNYGSDTIYAVQFEYGLEGQTLTTYTWQGSLTSLNVANIMLPSFSDLENATGGNNKFVVHILQVNGTADDDSLNNTLKSTFTAPPVLQGGNFYIALITSGPFQTQANPVSWTIQDLNGNILFQRFGNLPSKAYLDTFHLADGCYKLTVDASTLGVGLSFFNYINPGSFKLFNLSDFSNVPLPKSNFTGSYLDGNFGNGFTQYFTVTNSVGTENTQTKQIQLNIYPNPTADLLNIQLFGNIQGAINIKMVNMLGQTVYSTTTQNKKSQIATSKFANGIYTLVVQTKTSTINNKVVIAK